VTREEFAAQCERGAQLTAGALPVTGAILAWTAAQLKKGEPGWWKPLAKAWDKRAFHSWTDAWALWMACFHYEALNDAECPLVPYFPSCGGTAEADPSVAVARFLQAPPPSFYDNLRERQRRPYAGKLSALWMTPAALFFQTRRLSYYLVEADAGAGLDLAADIAVPVRGFRSDLIDARVGLDPAPLVMEDLFQRRWLTACQNPEGGAGIAMLDHAIEKVIAANKEDASFIQLAPCAAAKAPAFIAKNIPVDQESGLLVLNIGATGRMDDAGYAAYAKGMLATLSRWGDRGLWVEVETVRGEAFSLTFELRAHRAQDGQLRSMTLASISFETGVTQYDADAAGAFLAPAAKK
jgi:hypothetical protein